MGLANSSLHHNREDKSPNRGMIVTFEDKEVNDVNTPSTGPHVEPPPSSPSRTSSLTPSSSPMAAAASSSGSSALSVSSTSHESSPDSPERLHFCEDTNTTSDPCNAQWLLLWSTAVYASEHPSVPEQRDLAMYFKHFPDQCTSPSMGDRCYTNYVNDYPPRTASRRELVSWLCTVENYCRRRVGMKEKAFSYKSLMKRWRFEDGYL